MKPFYYKVLDALVAAGGQLTIPEMEALYEVRGRRGDRHSIAAMNRLELTEWVRPEDKAWGSAVGIRITDKGRRAALAPRNREG